MLKNNSPQLVPAEVEEQMAFERQMRQSYPLFPLETRARRYQEIQQGHVEYKSAGTQHMWKGWKLARGVTA